MEGFRRTGPLLAALLSLGACDFPSSSPGTTLVLPELPRPMVLRGFGDQVPIASCDLLEGPGGARSVTPAPGGRLLALAPDGREVRLLNGDLVPLATRHVADGAAPGPTARGGPDGSVGGPSEAWLVGDTLLVLLVPPTREILFLPWSPGEDGPTERVRLPFIPHRMVPLGTGFLVVSMGPSGGRMAHLWEPGSGLRPAALPTPPLPDPRLVLLASALVPVPLPEGAAAVLHPLLIPRGYRVEPDGRVIPFPLPVPDGAAAAVGRVPRAPYREAALLDVLATALDAAPGEAGGVHLLTRTGEWRGSFREKAVIALDAGLLPVGAARLPVNAVRLVTAVGTADVLVEDLAGRWYRCGRLEVLAAAVGALGENVPSSHGSSGREPR